MVERPEEAIVSCGQMPQHLKGHIDAIRGWRPPQFVVVKGHNYFKGTAANYGHDNHEISQKETIVIMTSDSSYYCASSHIQLPLLILINLWPH